MSNNLKARFSLRKANWVICLLFLVITPIIIFLESLSLGLSETKIVILFLITLPISLFSLLVLISSSQEKITIEDKFFYFHKLFKTIKIDLSQVLKLEGSGEDMGIFYYSPKILTFTFKNGVGKTMNLSRIWNVKDLDAIFNFVRKTFPNIVLELNKKLTKEEALISYPAFGKGTLKDWLLAGLFALLAVVAVALLCLLAT